MKPELENKPTTVGVGLCENGPSMVKKTDPSLAEKEKNWREIAEVRMVLYVVPAGIIFAIIGYVLSRFTK